jgi:uncharacterized membrane protein
LRNPFVDETQPKENLKMAAVTHEIIVNKPVSEVFEFWKNFENFPRFMENIESVRVIGAEMTHWKMKGPLGVNVEWDAKTTYIEENKKISWESTTGTIENHGSVIFKELDADRTSVTVGLEYKPPAGVIGETVAKLLNDPQRQLEEDLRRFKSVVQSTDSPDEIGEATSASGEKGADHSAAAS